MSFSILPLFYGTFCVIGNVKNNICSSFVFVGLETFVSYESIKRELKRRPIHDCQCDERLKAKAEVRVYTPRTHWIVRDWNT
jgi:uncharacterized protein YlaI